MPYLDPHKQRQFAVEVVRQLRDQGFTAYWAGGCVRDSLLARTPNDYDVATNALPEQISGVFRNRKTLAMGAAFGVMTVLGPRRAGQIEVATFRQDVSYSDGRHPDRVAFSSPEEDAQRRDFTINGMFYDPLAEQVIDFVGGQADLQQGVVRAIGNPLARFTEDKLRLLRAVRFASVFDFRLEENTLVAIGEMASQISIVSAERIADEMRTMLEQPGVVRAVQLLYITGLLAAILPETVKVAEIEGWSREATAAESSSPQAWPATCRTLALLQAIQQSSFPLALAILLHAAAGENLAETVGRRWRLARIETDRLAFLLKNQHALIGAASQRWSQLQPLLVADEADDLLKLFAAQAELGLADPRDVAFCRAQLQLPAAQLNPSPLITGADLIAQGIPAGPAFARLLQSAREAQLDGEIADRAAALGLVERLRQAGHT
ncbi:MAG TPA: CCA tRNA nucleotidyltransferase [Pirellulales bacterium]|jgi:tRNA nucleotidyltransferase/poly(A) polymerase|nr:CCA tRNA nucleotidyltransferase [Pirellulales bacterium]